MKRLPLLLVLLLSASTLFAQGDAELRAADPKYFYELYRPYPAESITPCTPAPKGYKPFYISHLGRHGSRWQTSGRLYVQLLEIFAAAHDAGELTPLGERFYVDWQRVCADAEGRYGDLSPAGVEEQRGIAERMYAAYPEVFSTRGGRTVVLDCRSTVVPRCILSMAAFVQRLTGLEPEVEARMESSRANDHYLAAYGGLNSVKALSIPLGDSLRRACMPDPTRFMAALFKGNSKIAAGKIADAGDFMYDMYLGNAILGANKAVGLNPLEYLFTRDELAATYTASNLRRYAVMGHPARFADKILESAEPLLRNIVECADRAIEGGDVQVTLRFAHDVTVIPTVHMLGIGYGALVTDDFSRVAGEWQCNVVAPMAANVQLVFYRNRAGDVLVKVLHCEREQRLDNAAGEPVNGVYYRWENLRAFLVGKLR